MQQRHWKDRKDLYSKNCRSLQNQLNAYFGEVSDPVDLFIRNHRLTNCVGAIIPSGAYINTAYSCAFAYSIMGKLLAYHPKAGAPTVVIISKALSLRNKAISILGYNEWVTPIGKVKSDLDTTMELRKNMKITLCEPSYENEIEIEAQMPFIHFMWRNMAHVVPVVVNENVNIGDLRNLISDCVSDRPVIYVVCSTTTSPLADRATIRHIESMDLSTARLEQVMSFPRGVSAFLSYEKEQGYKAFTVENPEIISFVVCK